MIHTSDESGSDLDFFSRILAFVFKESQVESQKLTEAVPELF